MKNDKFFIENKQFGPGKVMIIAELGTSHDADPVKAGELIDAAAEAGADCIKFQMVYADEILHPRTGELDLPGGKIRLYDRFRELELPLSFFADMKEKVEKRGLIFLCTPFGIKSARELLKLEPKCIKIASPELNYNALLSEIATYNLPTLLSTGVSRLEDIENALSLFNNLSFESSNNQNINEFKQNGRQICLLHCVTAYPAPEKDYNLRVLASLNGIFGLPVGLSDHSLDPCLVPALAAAMGASVIEKHFCLSRTDRGLDDPIALPPPSFSRMCRAVREAQKARPEQTLDALRSEYGGNLVESVLGDGIKRLAPCEEANYGRTNRSIHALRDIAAGEIIEKDMIASLRTEKVLKPGLPPSWEERIIGRRAKTFIPEGEGICVEDI